MPVTPSPPILAGAQAPAGSSGGFASAQSVRPAGSSRILAVREYQTAPSQPSSGVALATRPPKEHIARTTPVELADSTNLDIKIWGLPALSGFSFNSKNDNLYKTLITQEMIDKNILAANSIYVSTAHTKKIVDHYLDQLSLVFEKIALIESDKININDCLNSKEAFTGFKRLN